MNMQTENATINFYNDALTTDACIYEVTKYLTYHV